ncbi:hypothetical protein BpHYR1_049725 [Brachionus plicatilis]|uniref:Uncharacterized protein n=1 Tax=Brachionus plicatilis TaxID=10195 RepID=A0A3M7QIX3_BRAPC|nr:hypothetical protein BpHYR1_049725 [Brachionus plicatilis]
MKIKEPEDNIGFALMRSVTVFPLKPINNILFRVLLKCLATAFRYILTLNVMKSFQWKKGQNVESAPIATCCIHCYFYNTQWSRTIFKHNRNNQTRIIQTF